MIRLSGECNRCGACCRDEDGYECSFLEHDGEQTTRCAVYETRWNGMPIVMFRPDRRHRFSTCAKDSDAEALTIIRRGIGRGCSLTVDPATVPVMTFIRKEA